MDSYSLLAGGMLRHLWPCIEFGHTVENRVLIDLIEG